MAGLPGWLRSKDDEDDPASSSDEAAMRRVRSHGDSAAFARLVGRWEGPIRRLCSRMTGDAHAGEDLAQEAFARVFASRHLFAEGRKFSTWLWRIALNLCHEDARRRAVREQFVPLGAQPAEPMPDERAVESERAMLVRAALSLLPETHRAVVVLREYEQLKFREIAEVLNVPEGTVKWRMSEAMSQLASELRPALGDEPAGLEPDPDPDPDPPSATSPIAGQPKVSVVL